MVATPKAGRAKSHKPLAKFLDEVTCIEFIDSERNAGFQAPRPIPQEHKSNETEKLGNQ